MKSQKLVYNLLSLLLIVVSPLFSSAQEHHQPDINSKIQRLERTVDRQSDLIRSLEQRISRLEQNSILPQPPVPPYYPPHPPMPIPNEPGDDCIVSYNSSACANSSFNKYSIEARGRSLTECLYSFDNAIDNFNRLRSSGLCRSNSNLKPCQMNYNGDACKNNSFNKYTIEFNGKSITECFYSQDNALSALKKLKDARACY